MLALSLLGVVVIIIVLLVVVIPLINRRNDVDEDDEVVGEKDDTPKEVKQTIPVKHGEKCLPGAICIGGVASASPNPDALLSAGYVRESVTTNFHPFIIKADGSHYMPMGSWWLFNNTQDACLGLSPYSIVFLTDHGVYQCSKEVTLRLCDSSTPSGKRLASLFLHSNTLHAVDGEGLIYRLLTKDEFDHHYNTYTSPSSFVDCSHLSSKWYWQPIQYAYGREIPRVKEVRVVREDKSELLYLRHSRGTLRYNGKRWDTVPYIPSRGCSLRYARGYVNVHSNDEVVRSARGTKGVLYGRDRILFTLHEGWLIRTAEDLGNHSVRLSDGWVNLVLLENGAIIGISNHITHSLL